MAWCLVKHTDKFIFYRYLLERYVGGGGGGDITRRLPTRGNTTQNYVNMPWAGFEPATLGDRAANTGYSVDRF
jgi:hypothetical protein